MNTPNPFDAPVPEQRSTLTPEEQAEYARMEQAEADRQRGEVTGDGSGEVLPELHQGDEQVERDYPVENGAVRWDDAANGGDTSREQKRTYDTPWGRRELSATEVTDFNAQGVPVRLVDAEPQTSLEQEREELRQVELRTHQRDEN